MSKCKFVADDTIRALGSKTNRTVILVRGDWVWHVLASDPDRLQPTVNRVQYMNDMYHRVLPFEVGDTVEFHVAYSYCTVPGRGKVLAIHEDRAWVLFPGRSVPLSPLLTSIKRVS